MAAAGLAVALAAGTFIAIFAAAGEGDEQEWDPVAPAALTAACLVAAALCVAVGWLARFAATGNRRRPGWRLMIGAPAAYALLLATIFGRP